MFLSDSRGEKPRERKHFRLHPHPHPKIPHCKRGCGAAALKPGEAALPTSHPRGYFYCTKRLLEAALVAARTGETCLRPCGALSRGPTSAASSLARPSSCIPQPPELCAACSSGQGCPHVSFADSLPPAPLHQPLLLSHFATGGVRQWNYKQDSAPTAAAILADGALERGGR